MRLFIAEKELQAADIARALIPDDKEPLKRKGFYVCGDTDIVTWASGHMYRLAEPHEYDPKFEKWRAQDLPLNPENGMTAENTWLLLPIQEKLEQLSVIHSLIERADIIVHSCDPDREGQLIGDEILGKATKIKPDVQVIRFWPHALNKSAIREALANMRPNREYFNLSLAAATRAKGDWLYGFNGTRAYSIAGKEAGYTHDEKFIVGRVQTPTLALIVNRDIEIENFLPIPFFVVATQLKHAKGDIIAIWKPKEGLEGVNEDGLVINRQVADGLVQRIKGRNGNVALYKKEEAFEKPPFPHKLSSLQMEADEKFGLTAAQTLAAAQALYEEHKLISYPRTDCVYLPESQHEDAIQVLHAIAKNDPDKSILCENANQELRSTAWDNSKLGAHHAIVPMPTIVDVKTLKPEQRAVYDLICKAFIAQFYEAASFDTVQIEFNIMREVLAASERRMRDPGWKVIYPAKTESTKEKEPLPVVEIGDRVACTDVEVVERKTTPPRHFNEGSIIGAMESIDKFVKDDEVKKILSGKGIGTPATRHEIIEKLVKNNFLQRNGRKLLSTKQGRNLIQNLPEESTSPNLTAVQEQFLDKIEQGQGRGEVFLLKQNEILKELVANAHVKPKVQSDDDKPTDGGLSHGNGRKRAYQKRTAAA